MKPAYYIIPGIRYTVQELVCEYFSINEAELYQKSKKRKISDARKVCCLIFKKHFNYSLSQIGFILQRDHSDIHNQLTKALFLSEHNKVFKERMKVIDNIMKNRIIY